MSTTKFNTKILSKLYSYFNQKLDLKRSTMGWKRTDCVYCGGKHTMGLNFNYGRGKCFKDGCLESKDLLHILMDMENFETIQQAWNYLQVHEEYDGMDHILFNEKEVEKRPIKLPESFKLLSKIPESLLGKAAMNYMTQKRNLNIARLSEKGVGFCSRGKYAGYVIFPIFERGKLIFFQGRKFTSLGIKMLNPEYEAFGVGKTEILYNQDALYIYKTCYLTESIINAETMGDRALASLGKKLSDIQIRKILNSPCQNLILLLDPDALEESIHLALVLSTTKLIKLVMLPGEEDVNSFGYKHTLDLIKKTQWGAYRDFYHMKLNYNHSIQHNDN